MKPLTFLSFGKLTALLLLSGDSRPSQSWYNRNQDMTLVNPSNTMLVAGQAAEVNKLLASYVAIYDYYIMYLLLFLKKIKNLH